MPTQKRIRGQRIVPTYTTLRAVSWYANELANRDEHARVNHIIASMLFCAFTLEAYLNHIGEMQFSFWEPLKQKLSSSEKLRVIADDLNFDPDLGARPWQTFGDIFRLRPLLLHARTETLEFDREISQEEVIVELPLAKWEEFISLDQCQRFLDDSKIND